MRGKDPDRNSAKLNHQQHMRTSEEAGYWGVMGAAWGGVMLNTDCQES
jgi:hypothetical protein